MSPKPDLRNGAIQDAAKAMVEATVGDADDGEYDTGLSEAEAVAAFALGFIMRIATQTSTVEELATKVDRMSDLFKSYARAHVSEFEAALKAKVERRETQ